MSLLIYSTTSCHCCILLFNSLKTAHFCYFRQEEFLEKREIFRRNAFLIIKEMVVLSKPPPDPLIFLLVDQVRLMGTVLKCSVSGYNAWLCYSVFCTHNASRLYSTQKIFLKFVLTSQIFHSIFFLGNISTPPFSPEDIVTDEEMLEMLKGHYPRPFGRYSSQLPKQSPISCVLDMVRSEFVKR